MTVEAAISSRSSAAARANPGAGDPPRRAYRKHLAQRALMAFNRIWTTTYHQLRVISPCRLPASGPAILVCNHTSGLDPLLIQAACPRLITWMMASEFYSIRGLSWIFKTIDVIPVDRTGRDVAATRAGMRTLDRGGVLGLFPEGRIAPDRALLPFHSGVSMMALKARAPVYPAYLEGTQRGSDMVPGLSVSQRASVAFGPAVDLGRDPRGKRLDLQTATDRIRLAVESLADLTAQSTAWPWHMPRSRRKIQHSEMIREEALGALPE